MKKVLSLITLILLSFILVSCIGKKELSRPENLIVNKNVITFNEVEEATSYVIKLNSREVRVTNNSYTITDEGHYKVSVKAVAKRQIDSKYTEEVDTIVKFLDIPTNIRIKEQRVVFDSVKDASSYNLYIDGNLITLNSNQSEVLEVGTYNIKVQAVSDLYVNSEYSELKKYEVKVLEVIDLTYSKANNSDLLLFEINNNEYILYSDDDLVFDEFVYQSDNNIYVKKEILNVLDNKTYVLYLELEDIVYKINLEIKD